MIKLWLHSIQNLMPDGNITKHCFSKTFSEYVVDKNQSGLSRRFMEICNLSACYVLQLALLKTELL